MLSLFLSLLLLTVTVLVIMVLRKNQRKHTIETVDRTAPLPALGENSLPDFAPAPAASVPEDTNPEKTTDNWQLQVKNLRASQQYEDALEICRFQFPKTQAIQQAAIILRQQIKISQETGAPFESVLLRLYSLAAIADIYGSGIEHNTTSITKILNAMDNIKEKYPMLGYQKLKLLNKTDARLLEQLFGKPATHRHAQEIYRA